MILAIVNYRAHYIFETIDEIASAAINDGHYDDMGEFVEFLGDIDFYIVADKLNVSCEIQKPVFTIN